MSNPPTAAATTSLPPPPPSTIPNIAHGTHTFIVKGFSLTKGMSAGKSLSSAAFSVGGYSWVVLLSPEGSFPKDGYVSIFLALASDATNVRALFSFDLYDMSGNCNHKVLCPWNHEEGDPNMPPFIFRHLGTKWGCEHVIKRDELEKSQYLKDDYLRIDCSVGVPNSISPSDVHPPPIIQIPRSELDARYRLLLDNNEPSDVVFSIAGKRFNAHKMVFITRCPKFTAEYLCDMDGANNEIVINDIDPRVFKAFLNYLYRDCLVAKEDLLASTSSSSTLPCHWVVAILLALATKYELSRLRLMCECFLSMCLKLHTYDEIHSLAIRCRADDLKRVCSHFRLILKILTFRRPEFKDVWCRNRDDILPDGADSVWDEVPEYTTTYSKCSVRLVWGPMSEDDSFHILLVPTESWGDDESDDDTGSESSDGSEA